MSRDDSILYPGSSSASFSKESKQRKDIKEEKQDKRGKLKPAAEVVFKEIESEMNSVMYVTNIAVENAKDERLFMIEVMARKKYVEYLKRLQNKLDNILRERR
jgi:hypothetical protein